MVRAAIVALLILLTLAPAARAERWGWPVRGDVARGFALPAERYGPGGHRGIDIAAAAGTAVRAACTGRVTFAGAVPGSGHVVSVRCAALAATYVHLGGVEVRRGERLRTGERLGRVGAARHVHLGARRGDRYLDPLSLLAGAPAPAGPPPVSATPRRPPAAPRPPGPAPAASRPLPSVAWVGAALVALALPGLGVRRAVRRRRARAQAVAQ